MKTFAVVMLSALIGCVAAAAEDSPADDETIVVTVTGKVRTGVLAIGGETTGVTITSKGIAWELDTKDAALRKAIAKLDGKLATISGTLERRAGVEIKQRWIVSVTGVKER